MPPETKCPFRNETAQRNSHLHFGRLPRSQRNGQTDISRRRGQDLNQTETKRCIKRLISWLHSQTKDTIKLASITCLVIVVTLPISLVDHGSLSNRRYKPPHLLHLRSQ